MSLNTLRLNPESRSLLASLEDLRVNALSHHYQTTEDRNQSPAPLSSFLPFWPVLVSLVSKFWFYFFLFLLLLFPSSILSGGTCLWPIRSSLPGWWPFSFSFPTPFVCSFPPIPRKRRLLPSQPVLIGPGYLNSSIRSMWSRPEYVSFLSSFLFN
jgi:hypothetical protein